MISLFRMIILPSVLEAVLLGKLYNIYACRIFLSFSVDIILIISITFSHPDRDNLHWNSQSASGHPRGLLSDYFCFKWIPNVSPIIRIHISNVVRLAIHWVMVLGNDLQTASKCKSHWLHTELRSSGSCLVFVLLRWKLAGSNEKCF